MFIAHLKGDGKKEIQTVKEHLENVGQYSSKNAAKIKLDKHGELIGLLHDLGKYSSAFQKYIRAVTGLIEDIDEQIDYESQKGKIDHSTAGAQLVWNELTKKDNDIKRQIYAQFIALCIASHHSGLIDCLTPDGEDGFTKRMQKSIDLTYYEEVLKNADKEIIEKINNLLSNDKAYQEFLLVIKDIFQNKHNNNELIRTFQVGLLLKFMFSCIIDADRTDTADFENPYNKKIRQYNQYKSWDFLIDRFERKIHEFEIKTDKNPIDEIRTNISNVCKEKSNNKQGIFTLTVPTGGGKTLASLRFALHHAKKYGLDRIIYVIPYTSIIDQNAQVVRDILEINPDEKGTIVLEHHSNILQLENSKTKLLSENWDAPIVFTTTVQFLESVFGSGTRSIRRFHQLAKSVIIFDEIQTLPIKTVHLFNNTINFLTEICNTSVVLCTATQPLLNNVDEQKGKLFFTQENEIIPNIDGLFSKLKRVEVVDLTKKQGWSIDEIAELAIDQAEKQNSCLVVVNTKNNAINLYEKIINKIGDNYVFHLSTNMCPAHRIKILNKIKLLLNNNERCICVSTQLIEAGVDVDFGSVIRFLAGIDSIAQAAGRCNRNGKREVSKVFVVNPNDESIDSLIDIKEGKKIALRIFNEIKNPNTKLPQDLLHPKIMDLYFKYYFYNRANMMTYPINEERNDNLLNMLSKNLFSLNEYIRINNSSPNIYFRQSFKTAAEYFKSIDAPTIGIIVPFESEGKEIVAELFSQFSYEKCYSLLKKAQRYTVNVYSNVLDKLINQSAIIQVPEIGVYTLRDLRYYHPDFGLNEFPIQEFETLIT